MVCIGNEWSRTLFDGPFYRSAASHALPATSLVFVQSAEGNTVAADPSTLGGGNTDLHLVYEGLSRIDADAVMAGASTARGKDVVFSVWHPQMVALRKERGHPRHPAQVVVTESGNLRFDDGLMFQEPSLRVFVITPTRAVDTICGRVGSKPWIDVVDAGDPLSFTRALRYLRQHGIEVLSCVGGARTATGLLSEVALVSDIYLTTSPIGGGEPNTPFFEGRLPLDRVVLKEGLDGERGVRFEHFHIPDP
jgi:riboflavin biosynthesis pyrimidine reductase